MIGLRIQLDLSSNFLSSGGGTDIAMLFRVNFTIVLPLYVTEVIKLYSRRWVGYKNRTYLGSTKYIITF